MRFYSRVFRCLSMRVGKGLGCIASASIEKFLPIEKRTTGGSMDSYVTQWDP